MPATTPPHAPASHRRPRSSRTRLFRVLTLGLLAVSAGGAAVAGTTLGETATRPTAATAEVAAAPSTPGRDTINAADRGFTRTAPTPASSPSTSTAPSPAATTPKPATPTTVAAPAKPAVPAGCESYAGLQLTACTLLPAYGLSTAQMPSLVQLWNGESNWNPYASNAYSGAYGIPQALPGDKMASIAPDWQTNPTTQIRWGLQYIVNTYGTPGNALAQWQARSPHWY